MIKGLYNSLSALSAAIKMQDSVANNIANVNAPGYKKVVTYNSELSTGGVKVFQIRDGETQGYLIYTGRNLDLAINGKGYFKLKADSNEVFTRNGNFKLDEKGNIVDSNGNVLISLNSVGDIEIKADGKVYVNGELGGKIELFDLDGSKIPEGSYEILPGYLEASNVDMAKKIVKMIVAKRYFETNLKTTKTVDEMLGNIIDNFA